jgi:hypothetical protein
MFITSRSRHPGFFGVPHSLVMVVGARRLLTRIAALIVSLVIVVAAGYRSTVLPQSRATTADMLGTVTDSSKAMLPNVSITVKNTATGAKRTTQTDNEGRFTIPALSVGTYSLLAEASGFERQQRDGIVVTLGSSVELSLVMPITGVSEHVAITASIIDVRKTEISTTVLQQQIDNLPISGRNFVGFTLITPGVSSDRTPVQGSSATSGLTFLGQSARSNNIMVDGVDNTEAALGSVRGTFSQEAVREFQVINNSYSAEFGKATGGIVNILTRSGTNLLQGNAFFYLRDDSLNAKGYFERFNPAAQPINQEKASFSQEQFGGTLGGPLKKDRTFFFASFERSQISASNFVNIDNQAIIANPLGGTPLGTPTTILRRAGFQFDLDNVPYVTSGNQFLIKIDHQLRSNDSLAMRFNYADAVDENSEPFGGIVAKSRGGSLHSKDYVFAASYTALPSPKVLSEARFQYAFRDQNVFPLDPACGTRCETEDAGGPTIEVAGVANLGRHRAMPQPRSASRYQAVETLTYLQGNNQIKLGLDFSFIGNKSSIPLHFGGRYIFAALPAIPNVRPAVSAIQAVALGLPVVYLQGYGNSRGDYDYKDLSLFVQDEWALSSNLVLKFGLRYQKQFWDRVSFQEPLIGAYSFPADNNNFAPRIGFAWNLLGDKKTVLRAAFGTFYGNHVTTVSSSVKIFNGSSGARTLVRGGPGAIAAWNAPGHRLPEPAAAFPALRFSIDPKFRGTYTHQAGIGVDRELPGLIAFSISAVYARGHNHLGSVDYNPLLPELGPGRRPFDLNGQPNTSASIIQFSSYGESRYLGLNLTASRRLGRRYQLQVSYALSKAEDNTIDFQSLFLPQFNGRGRNPQDLEGLPLEFDPHLDYGPSQQDQRHRLVLSGIYLAPLGIRLSSIFTLTSGRPYNILAGFDFNQDGDATNDRARGNPDRAANDYSTTVGKNTGKLPYQAVVDVRVGRYFFITEPVRLEAIFEAFNVLNRANFLEINNVFGRGAYPSNPLPTFGQLTQTAPPRQLQFAVKLHF